MAESRGLVTTTSVLRTVYATNLQWAGLDKFRVSVPQHSYSASNLQPSLLALLPKVLYQQIIDMRYNAMLNNTNPQEPVTKTQLSNCLMAISLHREWLNMNCALLPENEPSVLPCVCIYRLIYDRNSRAHTDKNSIICLGIWLPTLSSPPPSRAEDNTTKPGTHH